MDTESFNLFRLVPGRVARTSTLSTTATRAINLSDTLISSAKFCRDFHPRRWPSLVEETSEELLTMPRVKMFGSFESCHWRSLHCTRRLLQHHSLMSFRIARYFFSDSFTCLRDRVLPLIIRRFSNLNHFTEIIIHGKSHAIDDGLICFSRRNEVAF